MLGLKIRKHIKVNGIVQGVGFRPFIYNFAKSLNLTGHVNNDGSGVDIEVEGKIKAVNEFYGTLEKKAPPLSHITSIQEKDIPVKNSRLFKSIASTFFSSFGLLD